MNFQSRLNSFRCSFLPRQRQSGSVLLLFTRRHVKFLTRPCWHQPPTDQHRDPFNGADHSVLFLGYVCITPSSVTSHPACVTRIIHHQPIRSTCRKTPQCLFGNEQSPRGVIIRCHTGLTNNLQKMSCVCSVSTTETSKQDVIGLLI